MSTGLSFFFVIGFVLIHLFSKHAEVLRKQPRSHFLSIAGGIAVAYVFLHLLPELSKFQQQVEDGETIMSFLNHHIYIVALVGVVIFYGLEHFVKKSHKNRSHRSSIAHDAGVFWVHIGIFALYNVSIGYLLVHDEFTSTLGPWAFFIALGAHFMTNDISLDEQHDEDYTKYGRWILTWSIVLGWGIGVLTEIHTDLVAYLVALLAGGIILNVMKEELPEDSESNFLAFLGGVIGFTLLFMLV